MQRFRIRLSSYGIWLSLLGVVVLIENIIALRWNVDVYHEGDKYPSIVAFAHGQTIFKDVNHIYGFMSTVLNMPLAKLMGIQLLSFRITGFLIKVLLCVVAYKIITKFQSRSVGLFVVVLWLGISPIWSSLNSKVAGSGIAWPTHYALLFSLIAVLLMYHYYSILHRNNYFAFLAGSISVLSWACRLEFLGVWVMQSLAIYVSYRISARIGNKSAINPLFPWLIGSFSTFITAILWLTSNGSLRDWYRQTILVWFSNPPAQPKFTLNWTVMTIFSFLAVSGLFGVLLLINLKFERRVHGRQYYLWLVLACSSLLGIWIAIELLFSNFTPKGLRIDLWAYDIVIRGLYSYSNFAILIFLCFIFSLLYSKRTRAFARSLDPIGWLMLGTCVGLFGLIHIVYADYLNIVALPFIIFILYCLSQSQFQHSQLAHRVIIAARNSGLFLLMISSILFGFRAIAFETYAYKTPMLKGLVDQDFKRGANIDAIFSGISKLGRPGHVWMFCITGLYSVNSKGFLGADQWVWNLQPEAWMVPRILKPRQGDLLVVCNLSPGELALFKDKVANGDYVLSQTYDGLELYTVT